MLVHYFLFILHNERLTKQYSNAFQIYLVLRFNLHFDFNPYNKTPSISVQFTVYHMTIVGLTRLVDKRQTRITLHPILAVD